MKESWAIHTKRNINSTSLSYLFHIHIRLVSLFSAKKIPSCHKVTENIMSWEIKIFYNHILLWLHAWRISSILKNMYSSDKSTYDMETAKERGNCPCAPWSWREKAGFIGLNWKKESLIFENVRLIWQKFVKFLKFSFSFDKSSLNF